MKNLQSLMNHLWAWIEREIVAQRELDSLLAEQEAAIVEQDTEALEGVLERLQAALDGAPARNEKRLAIFAGLAEHWQVAVDFLTLSSITERLGPDAGRLPALRAELREVAAGVVRRQRRISKAVATHRRITKDVFDALFGDQDGGPLEREGTLVDAEA